MTTHRQPIIQPTRLCALSHPRKARRILIAMFAAAVLVPAIVAAVVCSKG